MNRQRLWTGRLLLELTQHTEAAFVTLTYDEASCPKELVPADLRKFLREARRALAPRKIRFYAVGEYGDRTMRPHFHVLLFGIGMLDAQLVCAKCWSFGFFQVGEVNRATVAYVAKYTLKRMTKADDERLEGRHPEFARMSLRPHGIGAGALEVTADAALTRGGSAAVAESGDVPREMHVEGKRYPLGRYLRGRLRDGLGWSSETPGAVRRQIAFEKSLEDGEALKALAAKRRASDLSARARVKVQGSKRRKLS